MCSINLIIRKTWGVGGILEGVSKCEIGGAVVDSAITINLIEGREAEVLMWGIQGTVKIPVDRRASMSSGQLF